ncbi:hypothetical protein SKAU_G00381930 [Synaphobranchus kaupii]|uniref:Uncharacterized protein n=1 Tax=Synaphobranchus kaupii TaxID=118154 RepID=A0A9Q1ICQ5_SYNKA|nr:hypothetical protein SKAU_G00381930 [Synaphobranchus kaupii]
MAEVQDAEYVSLTVDMWTSINMDSYLGVTCHYITKETKLATVLLGVTRFPQSHTAVNIKEAQNVLIESWGISMEKIHCLVTDNAANMLASAQLLRVRHICCFAHSLNLVVKKALDQTPELQDIRLRAKSVVTLFSTSYKAKEKLNHLGNLVYIFNKNFMPDASGIETVRVLAMAALLDPRFKVLGFGNASLMKDAEKNLTAECASLIRRYIRAL